MCHTILRLTVKQVVKYLMDKILLIAGCSHAAGYEINGVQDCEENRAMCFGAKLAHMLGRRPINIAMGGSSNPAIARSVLEWFAKCYDAQTQEVMVLIAWSESSRVDVPYYPEIDYSCEGIDWYPLENRNYLQVNSGIEVHGNMPEKERQQVTYFQDFIPNNLYYLEMISCNTVLQMQYFCKSMGAEYLMCNTMHMFSQSNWIFNHKKHIDSTYYLDLDQNDMAFYWYYRNLGYENQLASFWHHDETPHQLYAEKLFQFWNTLKSGK